MLGWGKEKISAGAPEGTPTVANGSGVPQPLKARTLAQVLVDEGQVPKDKLDLALKKQEASGAFLGEVLVQEGLLDEKSLISFLAKHCKIPHLSLLDYLIDKETVAMVPEEICRRHRLLPIDRLGRNLTVAMVNPLDHDALDAVRAHCVDLRIKPILCAFQHWTVVADRVFSEEGTEKQHSLSASSLGLRVERPVATKEVPPPATATAPPEKPAEKTPALEAEPFDGDAVFDAVFSGAVDEVVTDPVADEKPEPPTAPSSGASSVMSEMASVMMDSMRDTYAILARRMELFRGLDPEDVARIFARGITVDLDAGQTLFQKGDAGDALYVILGGSVAVVDGDREIALLGRGDMVGEMALISNEPRSATAHATEEASLLRLTSDIIHHVMPREVSVKLLVNIIVTLSARLRKANN